MPQLTLQLPDDLAERLRARASETGHADLAGFVEGLLRDYVELEATVDASGATWDLDDPALAAELERRVNDPRPSIEADAAFWDDLRQRTGRPRPSAGQP